MEWLETSESDATTATAAENTRWEKRATIFERRLTTLNNDPKEHTEKSNMDIVFTYLWMAQGLKDLIPEDTDHNLGLMWPQAQLVVSNNTVKKVKQVKPYSIPLENV